MQGGDQRKVSGGSTGPGAVVVLAGVAHGDGPLHHVVQVEVLVREPGPVDAAARGRGPVRALMSKKKKFGSVWFKLKYCGIFG